MIILGVIQSIIGTLIIFRVTETMNKKEQILHYVIGCSCLLLGLVNIFK